MIGDHISTYCKATPTTLAFLRALRDGSGVLIRHGQYVSHLLSDHMIRPYFGGYALTDRGREWLDQIERGVPADDHPPRPTPTQLQTLIADVSARHPLPWHLAVYRNSIDPVTDPVYAVTDANGFSVLVTPVRQAAELTIVTVNKLHKKAKGRAV